MQETAEAVRTFLCTIRTSLKRDVNDTIPGIYNSDPLTCENLDTERIAFTMCSLWEGTIEHDTIARLNGNF
jgi:hypothetical protein